MRVDDMRQRFLDWRGVDDPCLKCHGTGNIAYGSTATWRGGAGGAMITTDVCDTCWGTGDRYRHGANLRTLRAEEEKRIAERAVDLLARSVGASLSTCRVEIHEIIKAIEALANKRQRGATGLRFLPDIAQSLANTLRRAVGATEIK